MCVCARAIPISLLRIHSWFHSFGTKAFVFVEILIMGVVYGEVFVWVGRILAKIPSSLLGWGIEWDFGNMDGVGINLSNWLSLGCMVLPLIGRLPLSLHSSLTRLGSGERRSWDVHLIRDLNGWELDIGEDFLCILVSNIPSTDIGDQMWWKLKPNGEFDICSFYNKLLLLSFLGKLLGKLRPLDVFPSSFGL